MKFLISEFQCTIRGKQVWMWYQQKYRENWHLLKRQEVVVIRGKVGMTNV